MPYTIEHIAGALKNARQAQGLTQRALGRKAAVPQSHISKIETVALTSGYPVSSNWLVCFTWS